MMHRSKKSTKNHLIINIHKYLAHLVFSLSRDSSLSCCNPMFRNEVFT